MGRIDEALRRASNTSDARAPLPPPSSQDAGADVFSSPWSFADESTSSAGPAAEHPPTASPGDEGNALPSGRLAVFRGFNPAIAGRVVSMPGAPAQMA